MILLSIFPTLLSVIVGFVFIKKSNKFICCLTLFSVFISAVASSFLFYNVVVEHNTYTFILANWINSGNFDIDWAIHIDNLSVNMVLLVNLVSTCVHLYSWGYMSHDSNIKQFMLYLSFFTFMMLLLVVSNNLLQLFVGWEGVGFASYLLIGFWYEKDSANIASMKAFIINRVGDMSFVLGMALIFYCFGSLNFADIFAKLPLSADNIEIFGIEFSYITLICILIFIGAMSKSAQLGLHTWLPDAMEGPTPVSALIHAATMVTAGVFVVIRLNPLYEYSPLVLNFITIIGATTAIFAALIGCVQSDIKKIIAYSTCSQLGYMFFAIGVSAYSAAMFHLVTHAFFKALLFLGAGSVIHSMFHEQNIYKMGNLAKHMPYTCVLMWIGSLSLVGVPILSGFYSKDIIIEAAYAANSSYGYYAFVIGLITAILTAFYSWKLIILVFHGNRNFDSKYLSKIKESDYTMLIPMTFLALGAIFSGYLLHEQFVGHDTEQFWNNIIMLKNNNTVELAHYIPAYIKLLPILMVVTGILTAYLLYHYIKSIPDYLVKKFNVIYNVLLNKFYFDKIYDIIFEKPFKKIGKFLWLNFDVQVIDNGGPNNVMKNTNKLSKYMSRLHTGYLYHYSLIIIIVMILFSSLLIVL